MSAPRRAAALRPSLLTFGQEDDLRKVISLTEQYKIISKQNQEAIDELCRIADGLHLGNNTTNDITDSTQSAGDKTDSVTNQWLPFEIAETDLQNDIESLRSEIASQKAQNRLNMKLLTLFVAATDKYVEAIRRLYTERFNQSLSLHREYTEIIESKQQAHLDLITRHNELTNGLFELVQSLGTTINASVDYKTERESSEYQDAFSLILKTVL